MVIQRLESKCNPKLRQSKELPKWDQLSQGSQERPSKVVVSMFSKKNDVANIKIYLTNR